MSALGIAVALVALSTVPAVFLGLFTGYFLLGRWPRDTTQSNERRLMLSALSAGLTLWFFLDLMGAATFLGVNQGLASPMTLLLVILFSIGFLGTILVEPDREKNLVYDPIFLAAAIIGIHGIGEGIAIGSTLANAIDPIVSVGGPISASSFVIHKALEAFIVSIVATTWGSRRLENFITAGLIIGVPTIVGALVGYFWSPNATGFYALGAGATLWLLSTLLTSSSMMQSRFKWSITFLAGIVLMFLAGTLHSA